jgi:quercetin dioxygenase-like cupin family protein
MTMTEEARMEVGLRKVGDVGRLTAEDVEVRHLAGVEHSIDWATLMEVHFEAGSEVPWHIHTYDEVGIAREGVVAMHVGHEVFRPQPGELVLIPAGTPHRVTASQPARHLALCHVRSDAMHGDTHTILVKGPDGGSLA